MGDIPRVVDIRVLGCLEVDVDGVPVNLGGPRLRALLARLVAADAHPVAVSALVELLWGLDAPLDADRTVRTYVSRLRKAIGSPELIITRAPGYLLRGDPDLVDAVRFERLAAAGHRSLEAGRPDVAIGQLAAALRLWRGDAYEDFPGLPALTSEGRRLAQLRHDAVQDRIDAELATGHGQHLVAELEGLTTSHPENERLWGQLMTALYRAGRQTDALEAFRRARLVLIEEFGVEPSPVLTDIHRRILTQDDNLLGPGPQRAQHTDQLEAALAAGTQALCVDGSLLTSRQQFEITFRLAEQAGDAAGQALAVLGLCGLWVHEHRTATTANQMRSRLRHALAAVDPRSPLALRLRIRLAGESQYQHAEHDEILAVLAEARLAGDPVAHAEALSIAHHCVLGPDHGRLRQTLALELIGESDRTGRPIDRLMGLLWHTIDLFMAADPHAERRLGELEHLLADREHLAVGFAVTAMRVMLTIRAGRFEEAEKLALSCAELGQEAGDADAMGWYGAQLVAIRWFQGRLAEVLPMLDELVHSTTLSTIDNSYFAALAAAAAITGDQRKAASSLARLTGHGLAALPRSSTWLVSMSGIAEAAYRLGDTATATQVYEQLRPFADLPIMPSLAVACFGSAHHSLGIAALTTGDIDRAVRHLHTAIQHNLALGHWPAVVVCRIRYGQALLLRGRPGDAAAGEREVVAGTEHAAALGMSITALLD
ncbi:BTAD domain-containing putative transcriptional regulator [Kutzneria buriramensis]|uniref:DNA-binding SARP family transcriptional activator n=1 Tax=Kutzneria buriramensis TaxID=1045776 RepID=A0A3E0HHF8_9PSEU|nr:DNA-binding SARP family transcriptional activator [Kutzneria buriramensis]